MASSDAGVRARTIPLGPEDPRELGAYTLLGKLGQGGMGVVYLGRSEKGRLVAIKVIRADVADNTEFRTRFRLEAETARRVARVCTAEVLDADPDAAQPYLVTEFIEGETLAKFVARNGPLADANLEQLAVGVAAALTAIHSAGIVHRDLKPANVILSPFGPRVIDFGIARALDAATNLTGDLQQLGTPAFMSPEQIEGRTITPAVDIFAWGGLVTFAATGHYPFGDGNAQVLLYRALHEEARLDGVDPALHPIVWHAMRKNPADRPTAQQLMLRLLGEPNTGASTVDPQDVTQVLQDWKLPSPAGATGPTTAAGAATLHPTRVDQGAVSATEAPTRLPTGAGGRPVGAPPAPAGVPAPPARPEKPGGGRGKWVVAGAAAAVVAVLAAVLLLVLPGKDKGGGSFGAFLPRSAAPLSADTMIWSSQRDGKYDIFSGEVPQQGFLTAERKITSDDGKNLLPVITPDRRTVIYFKEGPPHSLWAIAADGTGSPVQLFTSGPGAEIVLDRDARPSVDPTGDWLVVRGLRGPGSIIPGLWIIAMDGSEARRLEAKQGATDPAWSPNGEFIIYFATGKSTNGGNLVTIGVGQGAQPEPLEGTGGEDLDADPTWSPDGTKIAFRRAPGGDLNRSVIVVADPDARNQREVTSRDIGRAQDPSFSTQGKRGLVYTRNVDGGTEREVFVINPDEANPQPRQLTNNPGNDATPRWNAG